MAHFGEQASPAKNNRPPTGFARLARSLAWPGFEAEIDHRLGPETFKQPCEFAADKTDREVGPEGVQEEIVVAVVGPVLAQGGCSASLEHVLPEEEADLVEEPHRRIADGIDNNIGTGCGGAQNSPRRRREWKRGDRARQRPAGRAQGHTPHRQ